MTRLIETMAQKVTFLFRYIKLHKISYDSQTNNI